MAKVKFSRKEFEKHFKISKELEEKISMLGTHVESITDEDIEIEVLPNRPDLFSFQGFVNSLSSFIGKETGLKKYKVNKPEKDFKVTIDSSLKDIRPFTACSIVKNLKFDDEKIKQIIDIQERLHATVGRNRKKVAIGIYPLEKIKLPISFQARKPQDIKFQPLEMPQEMNGLQILQRHPTGREYAHLLEGLDRFPIFIDANNKILSMPPIINSHDTGKITQETKEVFIECSGFDFNILKKVLNILVTTLSDMGGKIFQMDLIYPKNERITTPDLTPELMKISLQNTNKLLGLDLKEKDLQYLLPKMGYDYKSGKVSIPAYRTDILHEVDIIEDIAIAYGYDKINPIIPKVATIGEESKESKIESKISSILTGLGLLETSTLHLIKADEAESIKEDDRIELIDSKTEYKILRPNLLIPSLRIISENKDNEYPQKIFEIGTVFSKDQKNLTETQIKENEHLLILLTPSNFTEIKQILDYLTKMLGLSYKLENSNELDFIEGRTAKILLNDKAIGHFGEIHPLTLRSWGIKMPVSALEISLEEIL